MTVKRWKEKQAPRVGRDDRYESLFSVEVPRVRIEFDGEDAEDDIHALDQFFKNIKDSEDIIRQGVARKIEWAADLLHKKGLPCRHGITTVFGDGSWQ